MALESKAPLVIACQQVWVVPSVPVLTLGKEPSSGKHQKQARGRYTSISASHEIECATAIEASWMHVVAAAAIDKRHRFGTSFVGFRGKTADCLDVPRKRCR